MKSPIAKAVIACLSLPLAVVLWACASGGGISGTSFVAGPLSAFGSIFVNDVEFDTTDTVVTIEGDPATVDDLRLGMFVRVRGPVNHGHGHAERIGADHILQGPVDAVNAADGTFSAMSQLVITAPDTVFDQTNLATLAPGDVVEVFGVRDADLGIRATRVEKKAGVEEFELTGNITDLDPVAQTFRIGVLSVDFSAAVIEDAPPTGLANGQLVEAESDEAPVGDVLAATGVQVINPSLEFEDASGAEIHGFVTSLVSETEFVLNGTQRMLITESTRFERGTRADLVLNAEVEADGTLDATGVLTADEIEFISGGG